MRSARVSKFIGAMEPTLAIRIHDCMLTFILHSARAD
jgi:hypothetical protein